MSSKQNFDFYKTLSFRLTLLYTGLFAVSIVIVFYSIYAMTVIALETHNNTNLLENVEEFALILEEQGFESLVDEVYWEAKTEGEDTLFFRLFDSNGRGLLTTNISTWGALESGPAVVQKHQAQLEPVFTTITPPHREFEARVVVASLGDGLIIQIGKSLAEQEEYLTAFGKIFGIVTPIMIIIAALIGWFMARKAMVGVEEVTQTAFRIAKGEYTQHIPVKSRGLEIERLAAAFNYMSERIHALINGLHEVTDNIAHDLRSPLTSLRGTAEMALINGKTIDDYQFMAANTVEECDRLIAMINIMLDISEAEAGASKLEVEEIDLTQEVKRACDLYLPLAEEKELSLSLQAPTSCQLKADRKKIQRLISNLLDNALKYTPAGGAVNIRVKRNGSTLEFAVEDNGVGIEKKDLEHIFQRFFRCDQSRSQEGSGLGLSLAQAIVHAHGGKLQVSSTLGSGSCFTATFPISEGNVLTPESMGSLLAEGTIL